MSDHEYALEWSLVMTCYWYAVEWPPDKNAKIENQPPNKKNPICFDDSFEEPKHMFKNDGPENEYNFTLSWPMNLLFQRKSGVEINKF